MLDFTEIFLKKLCLTLQLPHYMHESIIKVRLIIIQPLKFKILFEIKEK